jgi:Protein of unknown function (DUF2721)
MDDLVSLAPSLDQLSRIIGSVAAPAFLLGAVAAFISVLISRMNRVIDRSQLLHGIADTDHDRSYLKADIPRLKRRAALLNRSILYSTVCAIVTSLLIILAFVSAMLHLQHEYGVAIFSAAGQSRSRLPQPAPECGKKCVEHTRADDDRLTATNIC